MSGLIAVVLYHFCGPRPESLGAADEDDSLSPTTPLFARAITKTYIGIFVVVAVLVYGSFVVAQSTGSCRFIDEHPDIQTGSRPPF